MDTKHDGLEYVFLIKKKHSDVPVRCVETTLAGLCLVMSK